MNINFEDIITKANARKDALNRFAAEYNDLQEALPGFIHALEQMGVVHEAFYLLDGEGRQMLPPAVNSFVGNKMGTYGPLSSEKIRELRQGVALLTEEVK